MKLGLIPSVLALLSIVGCAAPSASSADLKTFTLPSWGNGAPAVEIALPAAFKMEHTKGPDFDVFYFSEAATKSYISIFIGHNPRLRTEEGGVAKVQRQRGQVGAVSTEWLRWQDDSGERSETLVKGFYGVGAERSAYAGLTLHIFLSAPTRPDLERLEEAAGKLRLKNGK